MTHLQVTNHLKQVPLLVIARVQVGGNIIHQSFFFPGQQEDQQTPQAQKPQTYEGARLNG